MYQDNPIFKRIVSLKQRPGYPPGRPFVVEDGSGRPTECLNKLFSLNPVGGGERQAAKRVVQRFQSGGAHPQPLGAEFHCWEDDGHYEEEEHAPAPAKEYSVCSSTEHVKGEHCPFVGMTTVVASKEYAHPGELKRKRLNKSQLWLDRP
jgi:hypothetical protein